MKKIDETAVILHYRPRVMHLCEERWPYMRMDEKIAEAEYFLLCAIRTPSVHIGKFWYTFLRSFIPYMDKFYRNESKNRFFHLSLDASLRTKSQDQNWTLLECLPDTTSFESNLLRKEFLASLSEQSRNVLSELIKKTPSIQIMRKYGLTASELKRARQKLQDAYLTWAELNFQSKTNLS